MVRSRRSTYASSTEGAAIPSFRVVAQSRHMTAALGARSVRPDSPRLLRVAGHDGDVVRELLMLRPLWR